MKSNPYLCSFDGRCEEAFQFYKQALGGEIVALIRYGDTPMATDMPAVNKNHICHARLVYGDNVLMGGDCPPDCYQAPQGFSINLAVETEAEAERLFAVLAEKGTIRCPMAETFWAKRFGMCTDQFGIPWMVNCEKVCGEGDSCAG